MQYRPAPMQASHWPEVAAIYRSGIATKLATFSTEVPGWEEWNRGHLPVCRWVLLTENESVAAWAALGQSFEREFYHGVAEVSLYVHENYRGKGAGKALLQHLVSDAEQEGFWTLESLIILENTPSVRLHERCGFRTVGVRERFGRMDTGKWHDVVLMERRSRINGTT